MKSNLTGEVRIINDVLSLDQAHQIAKNEFNEKLQLIVDNKFYEFIVIFSLGQIFLTGKDLFYKDLNIPKGTIAELIELSPNGDYKLYFNCKGNEEHIECIQIYDIEEFDRMVHELELFEMVDSEKATRIINLRQPLGCFWLKEKNKYIAIDNSTGDAWAEEFETQEKCFNYLMEIEEFE